MQWSNLTKCGLFFNIVSPVVHKLLLSVLQEYRSSHPDPDPPEKSLHIYIPMKSEVLSKRLCCTFCNRIVLSTSGKMTCLKRATCRLVSPSASAAFTSAPSDSSTSTTSMWPSLTANRSGVCRSRLYALMLHSPWRKIWMSLGSIVKKKSTAVSRWCHMSRPSGYDHQLPFTSTICKQRGLKYQIVGKLRNVWSSVRKLYTALGYMYAACKKAI